MRTLHILFKKELRQYLCSPFGWVVFAIIMLLQAVCLTFVLEQYGDRPVVNNLLLDCLLIRYIFMIYFLFLFPLITMKLFSEEEKTGTLETLMTAPIRTWHVVLSKYLSALVFYCCLWIPLFLHVEIFNFFSSTPAPVNSGEMIGVATILFLTGSFFTAVGCLASSLTSSQIIAAIVTFGLMLSHLIIGSIPALMGSSFSAAASAEFFRYVDLGNHINTFGQGLIDSRPFVYYLSMTLFTLLLTHHVVDYRRWKN